MISDITYDQLLNMCGRSTLSLFIYNYNDRREKKKNIYWFGSTLSDIIKKLFTKDIRTRMIDIYS